MYAHQVIESLMKLEKQKIIVGSNILTKQITSSVMFTFPSLSDLTRLAGYKKGKTKIFEPNKFLRPPYEQCWFDGLIGSSFSATYPVKIGVLIWSRADWAHWHFIPFLYDRKRKGWFPSPATYRLDKVSFKWSFYLNHLWNIELERSMFCRLGQENGHIVYPFLDVTLRLLNCKNVEKIKQHAPERLNKKRIAKGLTPLFSYHTLHIKPLNLRSKALQQANPTDIHQRIHLCRGHFKEYTAEAPLFGKYVGLWWWQPMVRGQNKKGIVMKDYEVTTDDGNGRSVTDGASMNKIN